MLLYEKIKGWPPGGLLAGCTVNVGPFFFLCRNNMKLSSHRFLKDTSASKVSFDLAVYDYVFEAALGHVMYALFVAVVFEVSALFKIFDANLFFGFSE